SAHRSGRLPAADVPPPDDAALPGVAALPAVAAGFPADAALPPDRRRLNRRDRASRDRPRCLNLPDQRCFQPHPRRAGHFAVVAPEAPASARLALPSELADLHWECRCPESLRRPLPDCPG